jgi:hypothetical protein
MPINHLVSLMFVHVIFDWVLQDRQTATNKSKSIRYLFPHLFMLYIGLMLWGLFIVDLDHKQSFLFSVGNCIIHGIIDWYIYKIYAYTVFKRYENVTIDFKYYDDRWFYNFIAFDQLLHGLCYIGLYCLIK